MKKSYGLEKKGLTGSALKWIAIITMLIDHIGATLIEPYLRNHGVRVIELFGNSGLSTESPYFILLKTYTSMRLIGRLAFPIFAFLLVEGFIHTKNLKKYILQIGLFALLSEIPFDLATSGKILESSHQNIYFTLFIGLVTIAVFDKYKENKMKWIALIIAVIVSEVFRVDYAMMGVTVIFIFYFYHKDFGSRNLLNGLVLLQQYTAVLSLILIQLYNGKRGKQNKFFFYTFYPAHLLLLYLIRSYYF